MKQSKEYTILYVDDEPANLRSFKAAFRRIYNVHVADSPAKGIILVKEKEFDMVVSDHKMPELVGTEFLKNVWEYNPDIRRVILSGFVTQEELQEANALFGLHAYISKPWDLENVKGIFDRLLSEKSPPILSY